MNPEKAIYSRRTGENALLRAEIRSGPRTGRTSVPYASGGRAARGRGGAWRGCYDNFGNKFAPGASYTMKLSAMGAGGGRLRLPERKVVKGRFNHAEEAALVVRRSGSARRPHRLPQRRGEGQEDREDHHEGR